MMVLQNYLDRADPANTAALLVLAPPAPLHPKHVFFAWGLGDTFTPAPTLRAAVFAMGLPAVQPILERVGNFPLTPNGEIARPVSTTLNGVTAACFQYAAGDADGHFVDTRSSDAVRDWMAFLTSSFATGTPTVP
jgi:hypothetical protein